LTIKILKTFGKSKHLQIDSFLVWSEVCVYNQSAIEAATGPVLAGTAKQAGPFIRAEKNGKDKR
jgi:hypothetical protein